jgi:hypothetical protein
MPDIKDVDAAQATIDRGGNGSNVNHVNHALGEELRGKTVGEIANLAAAGNRATEAALTITKQAAQKGKKY